MSNTRGCSYQADINISEQGNKELLKDDNLKNYCSSVKKYEKAKSGYGDKVIHPSMKGSYRKFKLPPDCICTGSAAAGGKKKTRKVKKSKNKKTKRKQTKKVKKTRRNRKGKK
jgi:hypothetical protein